MCNGNFRKVCRKIHIVTGLIAAAWFLLVAVTGFIINHQESLGLLDIEVSNRYLPGSYRAEFGAERTRLNVIITDLHSGRIFGKHGYLVSDLIAAFLLISILSGVYSYAHGRALVRSHDDDHKGRGKKCGVEARVLKPALKLSHSILGSLTLDRLFVIPKRDKPCSNEILSGSASVRPHRRIGKHSGRISNLSSEEP